MDASKIIGELEALDIHLTLAIDYEGNITLGVDKLLQQLSQNKEAALDVLAGRRFASLPDNSPHTFRSERMKQIRQIFASVYKMLELHEGAKTHEQWQAVSSYRESRLDENDPLAVDLHTACIGELMRQYKESK